MGNNRVEVVGIIASMFEFSHHSYGENFYRVFVRTPRFSGTEDVIPVIISEALVDVGNGDAIGDVVYISGEYRSLNRDGKLLLNVFAEQIDFFDLADDERTFMNEITLDGYIVKEPIFRTTPKGREISDVMMATHRRNGMSDYIPCIFWGRSSRRIASLPVGQRIRVFGRVQSREYIKNYEDGTSEILTAYEVSASRFEALEEGEEAECE